MDIPGNHSISISKAALVAGLGLLFMVLAVPCAEFYIFPQLIDENSAETANNILNNRALFSTGILLHLATSLCDVLVAWALFFFLKPVNSALSRLTAWLRLIYSAMYLVALSNLIKVLTLIKNPSVPENESLASKSVNFYINSFQLEWNAGLLIFGIHLCLLGYLVVRAEYVPKVIGVLLIIAGLGYSLNMLSIFLFPTINTAFLMITFLGEIIFMLWLLIKGSGVKIRRK